MTDAALAEISVDENSLVRVTTTFTVDDAPTDPTTVFLIVKDPAGTSTQYDYSATVTRDSQGVYHVDVSAGGTPGTWYWAFRGTGACVAQVEGEFFIFPSGVQTNANTLATLTWRLAEMLNDDGRSDADSAAFKTWQSSELDSILTGVVLNLYPRYARALDPATYSFVLAASTYFYAIPTGVVDVNRLDRVQSDGVEAGPLFGGAWEETGDLNDGTFKLHLGPGIVDSFVGDTVRINGYGSYDVSTHPVPNDILPLVLAQARAEAYRRITGDRVRFQQWLSRNQVQNVSVNELLQFVREATAEAARLENATSRTIMKPVQARIG